MGLKLKPHQIKALKNIHNGCILWGGTGSGKSITALAYYATLNGSVVKQNGSVTEMVNPKSLYIITPAKKRDSGEWNSDMLWFGLSTNGSPIYSNSEVIVDSWNNIKKYKDVEGAFFIFDEQRVVGYGAWSKTFIKISKRNKWILLSATPGDCWADYIPVFIANGYYRNKTQFEEEHIIWKRFSKYPQIDHYTNIGRLIKYRNEVLVRMDFKRQTHQNHINIFCEYDKVLSDIAWNKRINPETKKPIRNAAELCLILRRIANLDPSRLNAVIEIIKSRKKAIIFYNFTAELQALRSTLRFSKIPFKEWNGELHEEVPEGDTWAYLCQYSAASEAWNCVTTDTIIFYSANYSYKITKQASGRIDRLNTPYKELYYYHLTSRSRIDNGIQFSLNKKKDFNEKAFEEKGKKQF